MSSLLLVHEGPAGAVDVLLADDEAAEGGARVFRRRGQVVLRVPPGEVVVVRDVRNRPLPARRAHPAVAAAVGSGDDGR